MKRFIKTFNVATIYTVNLQLSYHDDPMKTSSLEKKGWTNLFLVD